MQQSCTVGPEGLGTVPQLVCTITDGTSILWIMVATVPVHVHVRYLNVTQTIFEIT